MLLYRLARLLCASCLVSVRVCVSLLCVVLCCAVCESSRPFRVSCLFTVVWLYAITETDRTTRENNQREQVNKYTHSEHTHA